MKAEAAAPVEREITVTMTEREARHLAFYVGAGNSNLHIAQCYGIKDTDDFRVKSTKDVTNTFYHALASVIGMEPFDRP